MKRYNTLDNFFKTTFGKKIYKVSLDGGFTCPNRDGTLSKRGCIFCSERGSGDFAGKRGDDIYNQIKEQLKLIEKKFPEGEVIAYFQNFTNTYADVEYLREIYTKALSHPRVMGLAIATRPDCLGEDILELLDELNKKHFLWVELGLQTINEEVAKRINRQYPLETYVKATEELNKRDIKFVTHIIVGLPYEKEDDALETAMFSEKCGTWGVKIHLLHVLKNTMLEELYQKDEIKLQKKSEYVKKIVKILANLSYNIVIHRVTGDGDKNNLIGPLWSLNKRDVLNSIDKLMKEENITQGSEKEK